MSLLEMVKKTVMGVQRPRVARKANRVTRPVTLAPIVPAIKTAEGLFFSAKALAVYRAAKAASVSRAVKAAKAKAKAEEKAAAQAAFAFAKAEMNRLETEAKAFFPKPICITGGGSFRKEVSQTSLESIQARADRKAKAAAMRAEKRAAEAEAKAEEKAKAAAQAAATRLIRAQEAAMWASRPVVVRTTDTWRIGATESLLRRADRAIAQATACGGEEMAKAIAWVKAYVMKAASHRAALGLTSKVAAN